MNKEQIIAIIQGGHTTDGDLADAILAELAKVQDPVAWNQAGKPLYLHPAPSVPEVNYFDAQRIADEYGIDYNKFCAAHNAMLSSCTEFYVQVSAARSE